MGRKVSGARCAVRGNVMPGRMCSSVLVGGGCGYAAGCEHKVDEVAPSDDFSNGVVTLQPAPQPSAVKVVQTLVEALSDSLYSLQVPNVSCQKGVMKKCKCRKCVIGRGDAARAAGRQWLKENGK